MEPISLLVGIGIPLVAAGLNRLVERFRRDHTKEIVVRLGGDRSEILTVAANADAAQIISALQTELNIEEHVRSALEDFASRTQDFAQRAGKDVDFVAQLGDKKVAIEVKNRVDRITVDQINRYLADEPGINQLLVLSIQAPPPAILKGMQDLAKDGRVAFVQVRDVDSIKPELFGALERALGLAHA